MFSPITIFYVTISLNHFSRQSYFYFTLSDAFCFYNLFRRFSRAAVFNETRNMLACDKYIK